MTWSLNEIESLAKKAARGAGMDWGLAEEAGKATRWLCAAGWPGAALLARHLGASDGLPYDTIRPQATAGTWTARGGLLCPLAAGAALADISDRLAAGESVTLGATACPLLLVPYLAWSADRTGATLELAYDGISVSRGKGETCVALADPAALLTDRTTAVRVRPVSCLTGTPLRRAYRCEIDPQDARTLATFAQRTYAPETEQGRLAGAGAGLTDND